MPAADRRKGVLLSTLDILIEAAVARITLNRPDKRNAINDEMRAELTGAFARFDADPSVRVVVLTGAGPALCAGGDLSAVMIPPDPIRSRAVEPLDQFTKPIIAAINGLAYGGGLELALACDIRLASTTARFALPEVRIGSMPGSGGTQRLPAVIGPTLAAQMILTGEPIDAARALAAGLVSELAEPENLLATATARALTIAANAPLAVIAAKRALRVAAGMHDPANLDFERRLFNELALTDDRNEGRLAFREKRAPVFKGK
jgi:E-phenylitaconyl-CoA hydratase